MMDALTNHAHRMAITVPHDQLYKMARMAEQSYGKNPSAAGWSSVKMHRMAHQMSSNMVMGGFKTHNSFRGSAIKRNTPHRALRGNV